MPTNAQLENRASALIEQAEDEMWEKAKDAKIASDIIYKNISDSTDLLSHTLWLVANHKENPQMLASALQGMFEGALFLYIVSQARKLGDGVL